jgi:hypothetical protein
MLFGFKFIACGAIGGTLPGTALFINLLFDYNQNIITIKLFHPEQPRIYYLMKLVKLYQHHFHHLKLNSRDLKRPTFQNLIQCELHHQLNEMLPTLYLLSRNIF